MNEKELIQDRLEEILRGLTLAEKIALLEAKKTEYILLALKQAGELEKEGC